jgi:hypothetical protein
VERSVAEPVSSATYQPRANPTTELPNIEAAWLLQRMKNFFSEVSPSLIKVSPIRKAAQSLHSILVHRFTVNTFYMS